MVIFKEKLSNVVNELICLLASSCSHLPYLFAYLSKETEIDMEGVTTILQGDPDHYQDLIPLGVTGQRKGGQGGPDLCPSLFLRVVTGLVKLNVQELKVRLPMVRIML